MESQWKTAAINLKDGLITTKSAIGLGEELPGAARELENIEPSVFGGYTDIPGFSKFVFAELPPYGQPKVSVPGQTGTSLTVTNVHEEPEVGTTITIAGVTGTYTVDAVSYSASGRSATLTLDTAMASSPADKASIFFSGATSLVQGLYFFNDKIYALRGGLLYSSTKGSSTWTVVNVPDYGTVLVAGAGQTGSSLNLDGVAADTYSFQQGDVFTIGGITGVYCVTGVGTTTSGAVAVTITPNLTSSPADNAAITVLNSSFFDSSKSTFARFNFDGTIKFVMTSSSYFAGVVTADGDYYTITDAAATATVDAIEFKDHMFFAKGDILNFSIPFDETDFNTGAGAGSFRLPGTITGVAIFRQDLIIFTRESIHKLTGTSVSDFKLSTISEQMGCISKDTVREVGGDLMYLRQDGLAFLGATERNNDFSLVNPSSPIQNVLIEKLEQDNTPNYCSVISRQRNRYRLFRYLDSTNSTAFGLSGAQTKLQDPESFVWGELKGINAFRATSATDGTTETSLFSNSDGYVYQILQGLITFAYHGASANIVRKLYTPFLSFGSTRTRKYIRRVTLIGRGEETGPNFTVTCTPKYNLGNPDFVQPDPISPIGSLASFNSMFEVSFNLVGSGFNVSFEFDITESEGVVTYDTILVEYTEEERR